MRDIASFFKLYTIKMWSPMKENEMRAMYRSVVTGDNPTTLSVSASEIKSSFGKTKLH